MDEMHRKVENINVGLYPVNPGLLGLGLLCFYSLFKLWLLNGVELGKDEAAYWYWGQHLDATYALLPFAALRLAHTLFPFHPWVLRLLPVISSGLAIVLLYRLCRLYGLNSERSLWAAAVFATSHWIWHAGSYLHPDGFLVACWLLSLYWARSSIGRQDLAAHAKIGLTLGLTVLCKYSGAFLALALLAWILLTRPRPIRLRLFLWTLIPFLLVVSPLLYAQLRTDFYLPFTLNSLSRIAGNASAPERLLHFLANPLFFVSPFLLYLLYRTWIQSILTLRRIAAPERLLAVLPALIPVAAFGFFALFRGQIKGNWILPAFLSLWPLAFSRPPLPVRTRRFLTLALTAGLLHSLTIALALKYPSIVAETVAASSLDDTYVRLISPPDQQREPTYSWTERLCEYHGWQSLGNHLDSLLTSRAVPLSTPLATTQYGTTFGLAYYSSAARPYYTIDDPRFRHLTDLHHLTRPDHPKQLLFVVRRDSPPPASLKPIFPHQQLLGEISRSAPGCQSVPYQVFLYSR